MVSMKTKQPVRIYSPMNSVESSTFGVRDCGGAETWIERRVVQGVALHGEPMDVDLGFHGNRSVLGIDHGLCQMLRRNVQSFHGLALGEAGISARS